MFEVVPQILERDGTVYKTKQPVSAGTVVYTIRLDKVNDVEYFFTFSYLKRAKAAEIANKLWYDGSKFRQEVNRSDNPQCTLISDSE